MSTATMNSSPTSTDQLVDCRMAVARPQSPQDGTIAQALERMTAFNKIFALEQEERLKGPSKSDRWLYQVGDYQAGHWKYFGTRHPMTHHQAADQLVAQKPHTAWARTELHLAIHDSANCYPNGNPAKMHTFTFQPAPNDRGGSATGVPG